MSEEPYQFSKRIIEPLLRLAYGKSNRRKPFKPKTDPDKKPSQKKQNQKTGPSNPEKKEDPNSPPPSPNQKKSPEELDLDDLINQLEEDPDSQQNELFPQEPLNLPPPTPPLPAPAEKKEKKQKKEASKKENPPQDNIPGLDRSEEEIRAILAADHKIILSYFDLRCLELKYYSRESEVRRKFEEEHGLYGSTRYTDQIVATLEKSEVYEKNFYKDFNRLLLKIPLMAVKSEQIQALHAAKEILRHYPLKWPLSVAKMIGQSP